MLTILSNVSMDDEERDPSWTGGSDIPSSVARGAGGGARAPQLACEVCKIACFLWF